MEFLELSCSIAEMCYCWVFVLNFNVAEVNKKNNCLLLYSEFKTVILITTLIFFCFVQVIVKLLLLL